MISLRAVLIGVFFVTLINIGAPYSLYVLDSSKWAVGYLPLSVAFLFIALVFFNAACFTLTKRRLLSPTDLGLVLIMAMVGGSIPTWGTSTYLVAVIAAPQYFASPENAWNESVVRFIETWLVPQDMTALQWFYNGIPADQPIPWGPWVTPLFLVGQSGDGGLFFLPLPGGSTAQTMGGARASILRLDGSTPATDSHADGFGMAQFRAATSILGRFRDPFSGRDVECRQLFHTRRPADPDQR